MGTVRAPWGLALCLAVAGVAALSWASPLSLFPLPWPDDSAFYLPALDLVRWPPVFRMHAQAPFVPSYDVANFNTMPALPLLLGLGDLIGISGTHAIRAYGLAALGLWACLLVLWLRRRGVSPAWTGALALAAALDPAIRWGATVVRPEIWVGLFWLLILMDLSGAFSKPSRWRIPAFLAGAAYVHFEAIYWVPAVAAGLFPFEEISWRARIRAWAGRLAGAAWRTTLLLSPWLLYVLLHWGIFWEQMAVQFGRLDEGNPYVTSFHSFFHSLFLSLGNPVPYPKLLNAGKIVFWAALVVLSARSAIAAFGPRGEERGPRAAAFVALASTLILWLEKPETWFTALIHLAFWPLLALWLPRAGDGTLARPRRFLRGAAAAGLAVLLVTGALTAAHQWREGARRGASWALHREWVDCIERATLGRRRLWQPHWPDALVELASRDRSREYFRSVDFRGVEELLRRHAAASDAIIHSLFISGAAGSGTYSGAARPGDLELVTGHEWLPFKQFSAAAMGPPWMLTVCQVGPFWSAISLKGSGS